MRNDSNNSVFCRTPLGAQEGRHCVVMEAWTGAWLLSGCSATVKVKTWNVSGSRITDFSGGDYAVRRTTGGTAEISEAKEWRSIDEVTLAEPRCLGLPMAGQLPTLFPRQATHANVKVIPAWKHTRKDTWVPEHTRSWIG